MPTWINLLKSTRYSVLFLAFFGRALFSTSVLMSMVKISKTEKDTFVTESQGYQIRTLVFCDYSNTTYTVKESSTILMPHEPPRHAHQDMLNFWVNVYLLPSDQCFLPLQNNCSIEHGLMTLVECWTPSSGRWCCRSHNGHSSLDLKTVCGSYESKLHQEECLPTRQKQ